MIIYSDLKRGEECLADFINATGVNIGFLRDDSFESEFSEKYCNPFCKEIHKCKNGTDKCSNSDRLLVEMAKKSKNIEIHTCHAGLTDMVIPILYEERIISYLILGQMKTDDNFENIKEKISCFSLDTDKMKKIYDELPIFDDAMIKSISNIGEMLAKYIIFNNILSPAVDTSLAKVMIFIEENLGKPLSVKTITRKTGISKSSLYELIHRNFGCTVSEYINKKRIDYSVELLRKGDFSMEEISYRCGFSSAPYFTKTFKKIKGITPLKYRRKIKTDSNF